MLDAFARTAVDRLSQDDRVLGVLLAGSLASGAGDRFSDLDLVVVVSPDDHASAMSGRRGMAEELGRLLTCFTGEHVGEPRLLICLYGVDDGDGVIHVDMKFVTPVDLRTRADGLVVLYDPAGVCAAELGETIPRWPDRDPQWFEDRVWLWLHYTAGRLARGEQLEALAAVSFLREQVLAPMVWSSAGLPQRGLRRIEMSCLEIEGLQRTVSDASRGALWSALAQTVEVYRELRMARPPERPALDAEQAVTTYIQRLSAEFA